MLLKFPLSSSFILASGVVISQSSKLLEKRFPGDVSKSKIKEVAKTGVANNSYCGICSGV